MYRSKARYYNINIKNEQRYQKFYKTKNYLSLIDLTMAVSFCYTSCLYVNRVSKSSEMKTDYMVIGMYYIYYY